MITRSIGSISRWLTSPKVTRPLARPLLYGRVRIGASDILVRDARSILVVRLDAIGDLVLIILSARVTAPKSKCLDYAGGRHPIRELGRTLSTRQRSA